MNPKYDFSLMFGSDSGEDEVPRILDSYFVDLPEFSRFYDRRFPLSIVRGRKGMGKSALLSRLRYQLTNDADPERRKDIVLKVTANELLGLGDFRSGNQAFLEHHWKQVICKRICLEIGKSIGLALTDDSMTLVEAAELEGYKGQNLVSALTQRVGGFLQGLLSLGGGGEGKAGSVGGGILKSTVTNPVESLRRYQEDDRRMVWVLIDDIDAKYVDDDENQQRVGAFFSALRSLAFNVENLRLRASVRTDVWYNLRKMEDQDKQRQYIIDIRWKEPTLRAILAKKILSYLQRESPSPLFHSWTVEKNFHDIMNEVFARRVRWGGAMEEPFVPIKVLAGGRPRWMGQLCRLAGGSVLDSVITMEELHAAMPTFGLEKMHDLQKEHVHQFSDLGKLVDAFQGGEREYNRHQLLKRIQSAYVDKVASTVPPVNGYPFLSVDQLGRLLFQIEFLSAREGARQRFLLYEEGPDLFDCEHSRQNKLAWTVSPSFRQYLRIR